MKKKSIAFFMILLSLLFICSCSKTNDIQQYDDPAFYKTYEDPALTDLFAPASQGNALLSLEEFLEKTENNPYVQYGHITPYDKFIELVGKPQREVLYIGPVEANLQFSEPFPTIRKFEWTLKNNKTIVYSVSLSDECSDNSANSDNIMKFGLVIKSSEKITG